MHGKKSFILTAPLILIALLVISGCGDDDKTTNPPGPQPTHLVVINNFAYNPQAVSISPGDTVTWRNDENVPHTVTSDTGNELQSPSIGPGSTYQHIFNTAGVYPYHCSIHPTMPHAVVNVQ